MWMREGAKRAGTTPIGHAGLPNRRVSLAACEELEPLWYYPDINQHPAKRNYPKQQSVGHLRQARGNNLKEALTNDFPTQGRQQRSKRR